MKLLKMAVLAAFVPGLALAQPAKEDQPEAKDQAAPYAQGKQDTMTGTAFGLTVKPLSADRRQQLGAESGVIVIKVDDGSAAEEAGVKVGDVITKIDNAPISSKDDLDKAWNQDKMQSKSEASFEVMRGQKTMNLEATLEPGMEQKAQPAQPGEQPPAPPSAPPGSQYPPSGGAPKGGY